MTWDWDDAGVITELQASCPNLRPSAEELTSFRSGRGQHLKLDLLVALAAKELGDMDRRQLVRGFHRPKPIFFLRSKPLIRHAKLPHVPNTGMTFAAGCTGRRMAGLLAIGELRPIFGPNSVRNL